MGMKRQIAAMMKVTRDWHQFRGEIVVVEEGGHGNVWENKGLAARATVAE